MCLGKLIPRNFCLWRRYIDMLSDILTQLRYGYLKISKSIAPCSSFEQTRTEFFLIAIGNANNNRDTNSLRTCIECVLDKLIECNSIGAYEFNSELKERSSFYTEWHIQAIRWVLFLILLTLPKLLVKHLPVLYYHAG